MSILHHRRSIIKRKSHVSGGCGDSNLFLIFARNPPGHQGNLKPAMRQQMGGRSERNHSGKARIERNQDKFPPFVFFFQSLADGQEKCFTFSSQSQPSPKRRVKCHQPGTVCQFSWRKIEKIPGRNGDDAGQAVLSHAVQAARSSRSEAKMKGVFVRTIFFSVASFICCHRLG